MCDCLHRTVWRVSVRIRSASSPLFPLLASDSGLVSVLVLLDLSAAFYTIYHNVILQRLEHVIRMEGTALGWFKSYLPHSFQFAHVNVESSSRATVSDGVPRGSIENIVFKQFNDFLTHLLANCRSSAYLCRSKTQSFMDSAFVPNRDYNRLQTLIVLNAFF